MKEYAAAGARVQVRKEGTGTCWQEGGRRRRRRRGTSAAAAAAGLVARGVSHSLAFSERCVLLDRILPAAARSIRPVPKGTPPSTHSSADLIPLQKTSVPQVTSVQV